jgi:Ca-activated chloride channel family protein
MSMSTFRIRGRVQLRLLAVTLLLLSSACSRWGAQKTFADGNHAADDDPSKSEQPKRVKVSQPSDERGAEKSGLEEPKEPSTPEDPESKLEAAREAGGSGMVVHLHATAETPSSAPASTAAKMRQGLAEGVGLGTSGLGLGMGAGHGRLGGSHKSRTYSSRFRGNTERYAHQSESGFVDVKNQPLSTFSADVDTASYANARRFLTEGTLPPPAAVRVEEFLNYFSYDYPEPNGESPFGVHTEVSQAPWNRDHKLVHIGIKTREVKEEKVPPRNLVFLLDVSGSMQSPDKLPLLQRSMKLLAGQLREQDTVGIVVYAGAAGVALPATSGSSQKRIERAISELQAGGSTNGAEGIHAAYELAQANFKKGGVNRVILATDGDFNVGTTSEGELVRLIEEKRKSGVYLTVLGLGTGNLNDSTMEMLADKGNGNYAYLDSFNEAKKVLEKESGATLVTVAKDVKFQAEFNPKTVSRYRLIGYENRRLQAEDFNDDTKDAGEVGAGHSVTALYEVIPVGVKQPSGGVDPLKYQTTTSMEDAPEGELLTVKVRFKNPGAQTSTMFQHVVKDANVVIESASRQQRFAAAVAEFGLLLSQSENTGSAKWTEARTLARGALSREPTDEQLELLSLIAKAQSLSGS